MRRCADTLRGAKRTLLECALVARGDPWDSVSAPAALALDGLRRDGYVDDDALDEVILDALRRLPGSVRAGRGGGVVGRGRRGHRVRADGDRGHGHGGVAARVRHVSDEIRRSFRSVRGSGAVLRRERGWRRLVGATNFAPWVSSAGRRTGDRTRKTAGHRRRSKMMTRAHPRGRR